MKQLYPAPLSNPGNSAIKQANFVARLDSMSEEELSRICGEYIWLSAFAANNPRSCYHWMVDACYDACKKRDRVEIYSKAHKRVSDEAGR